VELFGLAVTAAVHINGWREIQRQVLVPAPKCMRVNPVALPRDVTVGNEYFVGHSRNTSACGRDYAPGNSKHQELQSFDGDLLRIVSPYHVQHVTRRTLRAKQRSRDNRDRQLRQIVTIATIATAHIESARFFPRWTVRRSHWKFG